MKQKKLSKIQIIRLAIQVICFFLLPGLFIDAFSGVKAIISAIVEGNVTASVLLPQIFPTALLILATFLLGRFFCGWMCAFGTLGDLFHLFGEKVLHIKFRMNENVDAVMKSLKYLVLVIILGGIAFLGLSPIDAISPWNAFGMLDSFPPDFAYVFTNLTAGAIVLCIMMIGSLFVERFFCRYFCPMGAVFSLVSLLRLSKIKKPNKDCGKCRLCTGNCSMGIPLYKENTVHSGECIDCMKCVTPCPRKNVTFTIAGQDAKPIAASVAVASVIGLYYVGNIGANAYAASSQNSQIEQSVSVSGTVTGSDEETTTDGMQQDSPVTTAPSQSSSDQTTTDAASTESSSTAVVNNTTDSASASTASDSASANNSAAASSSTDTTSSDQTTTNSEYADGTYEGSGIGFRNGTTTVSVTISGGKITDIQTVSTRDDGKFYNRAFSTIVSSIISEQSTSVSGVSGATYSANGIMSAVEDALSQARG